MSTMGSLLLISHRTMTIQYKEFVQIYPYLISEGDEIV